MKKVSVAFLLIPLLAYAIYAQTTYKIDPESISAPARCYFEAAGKSDLKALRGCFLDEAVIIDVSRKIAGIGAISQWARDEVFGGRYTVLQIVSREKDTLKLLISFAPPGYGEGSPGFKAHYSFEFSDGKIIKMDLQYA
jgi:hypothetical protein